MKERRRFVEELMGIKGGANRILYDVERDRFNMPHCADTSVRKELNANRIVVDGKNIAIATQYPYPHQVEAQLQMLLDNRTPILIVLASSTDIQNHQLPEYFSGSNTYGEIHTQSTFVDYVDLGNTVEAKIFRLNVIGHHESMDIPVLHVYNWPDQRTVSPDTACKLVELIESTIAERKVILEKCSGPAVDNIERMLPVIHCKAGVGRTGQTIAALVMKRYPELTLDSITRDLRASRNDKMIQTRVQMETLVELEKMHKKTEQQVPTSGTWRSYLASKFLGGRS